MALLFGAIWSGVPCEFHKTRTGHILGVFQPEELRIQDSKQANQNHYMQDNSKCKNFPTKIIIVIITACLQELPHNGRIDQQTIQTN